MSCTAGTLFDHVEILAATIYGLVTLSLYVYLIALIIRKSVFHHPFFYQFVLLSITNMILWTDMYVTHRAVEARILCNFWYPRFRVSSPALKPILIGYYLPLSLQMITVCALSINRMTVVISPVGATQFWANHIKKIILGIILLSVTYSFYLYTWDAHVEFLISTEFLTMTYDDGWPYIPLAGMGAIISVITLVVLVVSGIIGLVFLNRSNVTKVRSAERNLFWTNLAFSITTGFLAFYLIMILFFFYIFPNPAISNFMITIRGWLYDINCLIPAWLLIATNKHIRQHVLPFQKNKVASVSQISRGS